MRVHKVLVSKVMTETREASPSHFLFKIESCSLLLTHRIHHVETSEFAAGGYKWKLIIDLNDDKTGKDHSDYISVKLAMSDIFSLPANWDVNAAFSIFLFNHISCNYVYTQGGTRRFLAMKPEWGISEFISKKVLMNPSNGYLMNDNCVFGAEVFVLENSAVHNSLSLKNVSAPYKHCFNIPKFSEIKKNLWTSEKFTVEGQQWFVKMYPKSVIDGANQYMSIYLHYAGSERVMASYTIRLRNQITVKHKFGTITSPWFAAGSYWGWYKFADVSLLKDAAQGFIIKDCLKLEIEISVLAVIK